MSLDDYAPLAIAKLQREVRELRRALEQIESGTLLKEVLQEAGRDDLPAEMAYRSARLIARAALASAANA